ncbi:MAG: hypothetical protein H8E21_09130 [Gammaproteobacteria bacterium]|nr:hypothetical protein [Gammaproteobacteria bacterium]
MRIFPYLLLAIFVTGCSTVNQPTETTIALPTWVDNPEYPGHIGITASALPQQKGGIEAQRRVAKILARAEMSRFKSASVESQSRIATTSSTSGGVKISADDFKRVSTVGALQLNDVKVIQEWTHPETGELFMWLAYPMTR